MRNLRIDFSNRSKGWKYNGFFTESGIVGMLEAKEMKLVDMIFPIVAGFIDRMCGEDSTCPTTRIATQLSTATS